MENNEKTPQPEKVIYVPMASSMEGFQEDDEIDLLELWSILWSGRWFIATLSAACVFIAVVAVMFIMPDIYKASGTIFLTGKEDSSSSRLQSLASRLPIDIGMGQTESSSSQDVLTFLNSRDFRMDIVRKYELLPVIYKRYMECRHPDLGCGRSRRDPHLPGCEAKRLSWQHV